MMEDAFWMVKGEGNPTVKHLSETQAVNEAKRLAAYNPGETFFVLKVVMAFRKTEVDEIEINPFPIPF